MHLIELNKVKPGMTLAKSVSTLQEQLLMNPDVRLTEKNIHILKSWGVQEIWINEEAGEDAAASMDSENALRASIDEALRAKFADTLSDPVMEEILRISGNILEKRLLTKEKHYGSQ